MKQIIEGKTYDTDTAKRIWSLNYSEKGDAFYWQETLYKKRTGEYFIHGEGGPISRYAKIVSEDERAAGEKIVPITEEYAQKWMKRFMKPAEE